MQNMISIQQPAFKFPKKDECMKTIDGVLLGYCRNDLDLNEKEYFDLESDDDELEDNLRQEHEDVIKRGHQSADMLPETKRIGTSFPKFDVRPYHQN